MFSCPNCKAELTDNFYSFICKNCKKQLKIVDNNVLIVKNQDSRVNFSKLKIGTRGSYLNNSFIVIGEIRLFGVMNSWSEFFLDFGNENYGWLTDINGVYFIKFSLNKTSELFLSSCFSKEMINSLKYIVEHNLNLLGSRVVINNSKYIHSFILSSDTYSIKGSIDNSFNSSGVSLSFLKDDQSEFYFTQNINSSVYQLANKVLENNLMLYEYRTILEICEPFGAKKYRLTSLSCPNCNGYNPNIVGVSHVCYCIFCNTRIDLTYSPPRIDKNHKPTVEFNQDFLSCGVTGTINRVRYIVVGRVEWQVNDLFFVDYILHTQSSNIATVLRKKHDNLWCLFQLDFIHDLTDLVEFKKSTKEELFYSPISFTGSFPYEINNNTKLCITEKDDKLIEYIKIEKNNLVNEFILSHEFVQVLKIDISETCFKIKT